MAKASKDEGVKAVLAKRMVEQRLPRALKMKEKVDRGELLDEFDLKLLETVVTESNSLSELVANDPQARDIASRMLQLYNEITTRALENERAQAPKR